MGEAVACMLAALNFLRDFPHISLPLRRLNYNITLRGIIHQTSLERFPPPRDTQHNTGLRVTQARAKHYVGGRPADVHEVHRSGGGG